MKAPAKDSRNLTDEQKIASPLPIVCGACHEDVKEVLVCSHNPRGLEHFVTGTGQLILVHRQVNCKGFNCVIHCPSHHVMSHLPTHWRWDRYMMERICEHGVGHPDPDDIAYTKQNDVHGCDGCCSPEVTDPIR